MIVIRLDCVCAHCVCVCVEVSVPEPEGGKQLGLRVYPHPRIVSIVSPLLVTRPGTHQTSHPRQK